MSEITRWFLQCLVLTHDYFFDFYNVFTCFSSLHRRGTSLFELFFHLFNNYQVIYKHHYWWSLFFTGQICIKVLWRCCHKKEIWNSPWFRHSCTRNCVQYYYHTPQCVPSWRTQFKFAISNQYGASGSVPPDTMVGWYSAPFHYQRCLIRADIRVKCADGGQVNRG